MGLRGLLVERDEEIASLEQTLSAAADGVGGTVVIEGPAGKGKSRLISVAGDLARDAGMQILGGSGNELERDFPFGVAIQLFEPRWHQNAGVGMDSLLAGAAGLARGLLETRTDTPVSPGAQEYSLIHGLFWLVCNLISPPTEEVSGGPLVLLVDDVHWADRSSLRFLQYLAERIEDLPAVLVVALRPGEEYSDSRALYALRDSGSATHLRPDSLSDDGVATVVQAQFPDTEEEFAAACARLTRGNPFLLVELLAQVRADGLEANAHTARRLDGLAPEGIVNVVISRLGAMSNATRALVLAVSVLGDGASLRHAARLAGLKPPEAAAASDALASMHIFHSGEPLSFVHPLIRSAVVASTSPLALGQAHCRAAEILAADGVSPEIVAAHLLACPPEGDQRAVVALRAAGRNALGRGAATSAVRLLERALAEPPELDALADVIGELAYAEALTGSPRAVERLGEAIELAERPVRRAELKLAQGRALYAEARYAEAARVLQSAISEPELLSERLIRELEASYVSAASLVPALRGAVASRHQTLIERVISNPCDGEQLALAHVAAHQSMLGTPRPLVRSLVDLAWGDGTLIEAATADALGWQFLTAALLFVDELERDLEVCDAALVIARDRDSPVLSAAASYARVWPLYEQGRINEAMAEVETAVDAGVFGCSTYFSTRQDALAWCHLMRGELPKVEAALTALDHPRVKSTIRFPFLLDLRAQLRLAQHRPADALRDAISAGELLESHFAATNPGVLAWRSTAALAHLAMGQEARAETLAVQELEQARALGITRVVIRDLRIIGLASGGPEGITLLKEAVRTGELYPTRLEYVHALLSCGAALRRSNQRAAARDPLRRALELSHKGGISALVKRAETELAAAGARPRRGMLSGVESLTPSERRVADLAAEGLTTRQIAESLFVTPKTVEFHLRHVYQKLDIRSRSQLSDALGGEGPS